MILAWKITNDYWAKLIEGKHSKRLYWRLETIRVFEYAKKHIELLTVELRNNIHRLPVYIAECEETVKNNSQPYTLWPKYFRYQGRPAIEANDRSEYQRKWMKNQNENLTAYQIRQSFRNLRVFKEIGMKFDKESVPEELIIMRREEILIKRKIRQLKGVMNEQIKSH